MATAQNQLSPSRSPTPLKATGQIWWERVQSGAWTEPWVGCQPSRHPSGRESVAVHWLQTGQVLVVRKSLNVFSVGVRYVWGKRCFWILFAGAFFILFSVCALDLIHIFSSVFISNVSVDLYFFPSCLGSRENHFPVLPFSSLFLFFFSFFLVLELQHPAY